MPNRRIFLLRKRLDEMAEMSEPFREKARITIQTITERKRTSNIIARQLQTIFMVTPPIRAYSENPSLIKKTIRMAKANAIRNCNIRSIDNSLRRSEREERFAIGSPISLRRPLILDINNVRQFTTEQITSNKLISANIFMCLRSIGAALGPALY